MGVVTNRNPDTPWESNFREEMKRIRQLLGWTQTDLANQVKNFGLPFHQQTIQRIEKGERPVRLDEAYAIAQCLESDLASMTAPGSLDTRSLIYAVSFLGRRSENISVEIANWDSDLEDAVEQLAFELQERLSRHDGVGDFLASCAAAWLLKGLRALEAKRELFECLLEVGLESNFASAGDMVVQSQVVTAFSWIENPDHETWRNLHRKDRPIFLDALPPKKLMERMRAYADAEPDEAS